MIALTKADPRLCRRAQFTRSLYHKNVNLSIVPLSRYNEKESEHYYETALENSFIEIIWRSNGG